MRVALISGQPRANNGRRPTPDFPTWCKQRERTRARLPCLLTATTTAPVPKEQEARSERQVAISPRRRSRRAPPSPSGRDEMPCRSCVRLQALVKIVGSMRMGVGHNIFHLPVEPAPHSAAWEHANTRKTKLGSKQASPPQRRLSTQRGSKNQRIERPKTCLRPELN